MSQALDSFDRKILNLIQRDCSVPAEVIAEQVGLSTSAVQRRIKRMRQGKIITGQVAVIDPKCVGRPLTFIAAVEIERERPELLQHLRRWCDAEDSVQQVYYVTGTTDFFMIIVAGSIETYEEITARLIADNQNIRRVTTNVVLHSFKRGLFVLAEETD